MGKTSKRRPKDPRYCDDDELGRRWKMAFGQSGPKGGARAALYCTTCKKTVQPCTPPGLSKMPSVVMGLVEMRPACPVCGGNVIEHRKVVHCDVCGGSGKVKGGLCPKCRGGGECYDVGTAR